MSKFFMLLLEVPYFYGYNMQFFPFKQSQKSRSLLKDGSRFFGLYRKGKTLIIAKFHRTDLVVCSHFERGKTMSYSQRNRVNK